MTTEKNFKNSDYTALCKMLKVVYCKIKYRVFMSNHTLKSKSMAGFKYSEKTDYYKSLGRKTFSD